MNLFNYILSVVTKSVEDRAVKAVDDYSAKSKEEQIEEFKTFVKNGQEFLQKAKDNNAEQLKASEDVPAKDSSNTTEKKSDNGTTGISANKNNNSDDSPQPVPSKNSTPVAGEKVVCKGAKCSCILGTTKQVSVEITSNKHVYINSTQLVATVSDTKFSSPNPFGNCPKNNNSACTFAAAAEWVINAGNTHPSINGSKVLTEKGILKCVTGGIITLDTHGQQKNVSSFDINKLDSSICYAINCNIDVDAIKKDIEKPNNSVDVIRIQQNGIAIKETDTVNKIAYYNIKRGVNCKIVATKHSKNNTNLTNWLIADEKSWNAGAKSEKVETRGIKRNSAKDATLLVDMPLVFDPCFKEGTYYIEGFGSSVDLHSYNDCTIKLTVHEKNAIEEIIVPERLIANTNFDISIKTLFDPDHTEKLSVCIKQDKNYIKEPVEGKAVIPIEGLPSGRYEIEASFIGKEASTKTKIIGLSSNRVNTVKSLLPFTVDGSTLIAVKGQIVTLQAILAIANRVQDNGRIKWSIENPLKKKLDKEGLTCDVPLEHNGDYSIQAYFSDEFNINNKMVEAFIIKVAENEVLEWKHSMEIEKEEGSDVETLLPYSDRAYTIEAKLKCNIHTENVLTDVDNSATWVLTDEKGKKIDKAIVIENKKEDQKIEDKNDTTSWFIKNKFTVKHGSTKIKLTLPKAGTYKLSSTCGSNVYERTLIAENSKIVRWKFVDSNEQYRKKIGWKQSFGIVVQAQGWEDMEAEIKFYLDLAKSSGTNRHKLLLNQKVKFDDHGKLKFAVRPENAKEDKAWDEWTDVAKNNKFWDALTANSYKADAQIYFTIKGAPKCSNQNSEVYDDSARSKEIFPEDTSRVYAYLSPEDSMAGYFALDGENDFLKKVINYGEKPKIVLHYSKGSNSGQEGKQADVNKEYRCVLYENKDGKDDKIKLNNYGLKIHRLEE